MLKISVPNFRMVQRKFHSLIFVVKRCQHSLTPSLILTTYYTVKVFNIFILTTCCPDLHWFSLEINSMLWSKRKVTNNIVVFIDQGFCFFAFSIFGLVPKLGNAAWEWNSIWLDCSHNENSHLKRRMHPLVFVNFWWGINLIQMIT